MATQITATLPTLDFPLESDYPTQEDWAAFSAAAEENFGILGGSWSEQMQLWKDQANIMSAELNNNSSIAQSVANYQGDWVSQGYTLGQTVSVSEIYYVCKLTHATGQNPTDIDSLYWNLVIGNWDLKADKTEINALTTSVNTINNQLDTHISLSGVTAYHLLGGNLSVDATVLTNGFGLYLYTGNTTTLPTILLGMDITSGDNGYLIKIKSRSAISDWTWVNSVRGVTKYISSNTTAVEGTDANMFTLSTVAGVTTLNIGTSTRTNTNGVTYVVEVYQTTHKKTGVTNQGKAYTEHYNPDTGFTIEGYEGSGVAGHDIPHSLDRKLSLRHIKNLSAIYDWISEYDDNGYLNINTTNAYSTAYKNSSDSNKYTINSSVGNCNASTNQYIIFGWRNSYFDESGKLIGNFEVGVYQGTGAAGNKVTTRAKLALFMPKRLDTTGNWLTIDNQRNYKALYVNLNAAESISSDGAFYTDGFVFTDASNAFSANTSGGQYLYFGIYDNDNGSGKSKYPKATDTANVQINNGIIPLAHGIDSNGSKNSIVVANETITGLTYTEGKNYLYRHDTGYGVKPYKERKLHSELIRRFAGEQPDYYDVESNKWFNCDAGAELVTNGTFSSGVTTGWSTTTGFTMSVQNGTLKIDRNITTPTGGVYQNIVTTIGKKYILTLDIDYISAGGATVWIDSGNTLSTNVTVTGKQLIEFTAINSSTKIEFLQHGVAQTGTINIDNISVFPIDIVPTTEITESRNYMNHIVHADADGGVLYVEELPKIEYKNIIKADEYLGSNAISLSVAFDLTTTPITIKGKMIGAKALIRTGSGIADIYLNDDLKGTELKLDGITNGNQVRVLAITDDKITIETSNSSGTATNYTYTSINGVGE